MDQIIKVATFLEQQHDSQVKNGTPAKPEVVSQTKPMFAGQRGFQEQPGTLLIPGGPGGTDVPATPSTWVKPGTPGTIGTTENARRMAMMTYSDPNAIDANLSLLTHETDPAAFNDQFAGAPKGSKVDIDLTDEAAKLFQTMGVDVKAGPMPAQTYQQLKELLGVMNLGKTEAGSMLQMNKLKTEVAKLNAELKLKSEQAKTVEGNRKMFEKIMGGAGVSTGTVKSPENSLLTGSEGAKDNTPAGSISIPPNVMKALIQGGDGSEADASDGFTYTYSGGTFTKKKSKRR